LLVLGLEVQIMHGAGKMFRSLRSALNKRFVDDHLGGDVRQFTSLPHLHLLGIGSKFRFIRSTPTEIQSMSENDFECLASTGVNAPGTMRKTPNCRERSMRQQALSNVRHRFVS